MRDIVLLVLFSLGLLFSIVERINIMRSKTDIAEDYQTLREDYIKLLKENNVFRIVLFAILVFDFVCKVFSF